MDIFWNYTIYSVHIAPDNSPRSSDLVVDKRMKNILYDVKFWVHMFSGLFGSVVDKRTRALYSCLKIGGELSGANCPGGELSGYQNVDCCD